MTNPGTADPPEGNSAGEQRIGKGFLPIGPFTLGVRDLAIDTSTGKQVSGYVVVSFDVSTWWARIALDQLLECRRSNQELLAAEAANNLELVKSGMASELSHGMLATVAAGIAIDSFYARLQKFAPIPVDVKEGWKRSRTARYKRFFEVMKSVFEIESANMGRLENMLREIARFRDAAIHPDPTPRRLEAHPDVPYNVEWRSVAFGFANVTNIIKQSLQVLSVPCIRKNKVKRLQQYVDAHCKAIEAITSDFQLEFGNLWDGPEAPEKAAPGDSPAT